MLFVYAFLSPLYAFLPIYLNSVGVEGNRLGIVMALIPLVSIIGQFIIGNIADRFKNMARLLFVCIYLCILFCLFFFLPLNFYLMLLIICALFFFLSSIGPLNDIILINRCSSLGLSFGKMRLFGTFGYLIATPIIGYFIGLNVYYIFILTIAFGVVYSGFALLIEPVAGQREKSEKFDILGFIKKREIFLMLITALVLGTAIGFNSTFFPKYYTTTLMASSSLFGVINALYALLEIPVFLLFDKILAKFKVRNIILFTIVIAAIRFFLVFVLRDKYLLLITALLHGPHNILLFYCCSFYIKKTTAKAGIATGIMIFNIAYVNASRIIGSIIGTSLINIFGGFEVVCLVFSVVIALFGVLFYLSFSKADST